MSELPAHLVRGQNTRKTLMTHAVHIATRFGLEALTIGTLAEAAGIAKASVLGHYTSKELLQLATLEAASHEFIADVIAPSAQAKEGILRLAALLERWVVRVCRAEGGCVFASVAAEFDGRPGAVRERVQQLVQIWLLALSNEAKRAKELKELAEKSDPEQLVFCLHGIELSLNLRRQLFDDADALKRARAAIHAQLRDAATPLGKRLLSKAHKAR